MHFFAFALKKGYWLPPMYSIIFHFGCCLYRQQQVRLCWNRAYVKVSLSGSSIACYRLASHSPVCSLWQKITLTSPSSPPPPTHFLCPQRAAVHREGWPHATHTLTNTTFHHTHNTNILAQTFGPSVPSKHNFSLRKLRPNIFSL